MKKNIKKKFSIIITTAAGILFFILLSAGDQFANYYCHFCDSKVLNYQKFYEDELVMALYTHKPIFPGHSLIIPKRHVERFETLSDAEMMQIGQVIKKVNKAAEEVFGISSYLLLQKNGKESGQTVPHVHFHYIPRQAGDDSTLRFLIKMYITNFTNPITPSEMQEAVEKMKAAINDQENLDCF